MYIFKQIWLNLIIRKLPFGLFSWRFFVPGQTKSIRFHRKLTMHHYPQIPKPLFLLVTFYTGLKWALFYSPYYSYHTVKHYGPEIIEASGLSLGQQYLRVLAVSMGHGLNPCSWYDFQLYKYESKDMWGNIYPQETSAFHHMRSHKRPMYKEHLTLLSDKCSFKNYLDQHGVASAQILRMVQKEDPNFGDYLQELVIEYDEVFCKQRSGSGSTGAFSVFNEKGKMGIKPLKTPVLPNNDINIFLSESIKNTDYLIQPLYKNHQTLAAFDQPVMTIRIITSNENDSVTPELGIFYWPMVKEGNIRYHYPISIDLTSGKLCGTAEWPSDNFSDEDSKQVKLFVDTFSNQPLPYWLDALEKAQGAHRLFSGVDQIAWDLILSEDTAILFEGNSCWGGLDVCQWFGYDTRRYLE